MIDLTKMVTGLLLALCVSTLQAEESAERYNRISLTASATQEVENDLLSATLYAQQEGQRPNTLQARVNQSISRALTLAKQQPEVSVNTLDYRTTPIYRKQIIDGWRVRQSIRLQSRETTLLSTLIGKLQGELAVASISYHLSPARRQAAENDLMAEAIAAFKQRATLIAKQFGSSEYRLVKMSISTPNGNPPQFGIQHLEMARASAPPIKAGSQQIRLTVSGTIELKEPLLSE
ncbi:MAG: SIMPL domain-containing protein [Candidatus Polarisedimenticolaceae bacterium]|nr:SIMPL domain-containing protein [Candidatus Polarisedimenticolaceae bacterium]